MVNYSAVNNAKHWPDPRSGLDIFRRTFDQIKNAMKQVRVEDTLEHISQGGKHQAQFDYKGELSQNQLHRLSMIPIRVPHILCHCPLKKWYPAHSLSPR